MTIFYKIIKVTICLLYSSTAVGKANFLQTILLKYNLIKSKIFELNFTKKSFCCFFLQINQGNLIFKDKTENIVAKVSGVNHKLTSKLLADNSNLFVFTTKLTKSVAIFQSVLSIPQTDIFAVLQTKPIDIYQKLSIINYQLSIYQKYSSIS